MKAFDGSLAVVVVATWIWWWWHEFVSGLVLVIDNGCVWFGSEVVDGGGVFVIDFGLISN